MDVARVDGRARLSVDEAVKIRELYALGGVTLRELASVFGVSYGYVGKLVRGERRGGVS